MNCTPLYDVRKIINLKDMVSQSENLFSNKDAFVLKSNSGRYEGVKYSQFKKDIDALGTAFIDLGLKDKFIAVIGENRYEWCVTYLAAVNGIGTVVPLDKELPVSEIENLLIRSNASVVVFSGKLEREIKKIANGLKSIKYFISMDSEEDDDDFLSLKKLLKKGYGLIDSGCRLFLDAEINAENMSILLYTSGTTDHAKGVMLSHKNICSNIMAVCQAIYLDQNDSVLSILPLHHTYECTTGFLLMIYCGAAISFNEGLKHIAKNLREVRPTILISVPLIIENMYKKIWEQAAKKKAGRAKIKTALAISSFLLNVCKIDIRKKLFKLVHENIGGKIRLVISGAAAIDPVVSKGFRGIGIKVLQGYGLTENSPIATFNREEDFRDDSIGKPLPGLEIEIVNPDSDGIGEIRIKGDSVMLGYFENKTATEKVLKDNWLYTGDLGYIDNSGFTFVTGRKKNVIVTKNGKNIFPEEVESYLNKSPFILESLISGKYDEASGETFVYAQIVPDFEAIKSRLKLEDNSSDEILKLLDSEIKAVNKIIPLYKRIRQFTIRESEFPKTTTRKIKRYEEKTG